MNRTSADDSVSKSRTPAALAPSPAEKPIIETSGTATKQPATAHKNGTTRESKPSSACLLLGEEMATMLPVRTEKL